MMDAFSVLSFRATFGSQHAPRWLRSRGRQVVTGSPGATAKGKLSCRRPENRASYLDNVVTDANTNILWTNTWAGALDLYTRYVPLAHDVNAICGQDVRVGARIRKRLVDEDSESA
jgi:hypothetical protein